MHLDKETQIGLGTESSSIFANTEIASYCQGGLKTILSESERNLLLQLPTNPTALGAVISGIVFNPMVFSARGRKIWNRDLGNFDQYHDIAYAEDGELDTVSKILQAILRRNPNNLHIKRDDLSEKARISCAMTAYLYTAVYQAHDIPARTRSGFVPWINFEDHNTAHWVSEFWNYDKGDWQRIDYDGRCFIKANTDNCFWWDIGDKFVTAAKAWLTIRTHSQRPETFWHGSGKRGLWAAGIALGQDIGARLGELTDNITGWKDFLPKNIASTFQDPVRLSEIDTIATMMEMGRPREGISEFAKQHNLLSFDSIRPVVNHDLETLFFPDHLQ